MDNPCSAAFLLVQSRIKSPDKLRLAMLYALRYEDNGNLRAVKERLLESGITPDKVDLLDALLQYAGVCIDTHCRRSNFRGSQCLSTMFLVPVFPTKAVRRCPT